MEKNIITRKELYDLVWANPITTLANRYHLTALEFRKQCKLMEIPLPANGHWSKLQHGKAVKIIKLPNKYTGKNEIELNVRGDEPSFSDQSKNQLVRQTKEIDGSSKSFTKVSTHLLNPHRLIAEAKESLLNKKDRPYNGLSSTQYGQINIQVSAKCVGRALRFMDAFIKLSLKRKHEVFIKNNTTYFVISGEEFEIRLREKLKASGRDKYDRIEYEPSGVFILSKDDYFRNEWKDGKVLIEDKLDAILAWLELEAQKEKE